MKLASPKGVLDESSLVARTKVSTASPAWSTPARAAVLIGELEGRTAT